MSVYRELTRQILRHFRAASPEHRAAGMDWYDTAYTHCERIGAWHGYDATRSVVALAHLSPRVHWSRNLILLDQLLAGEPRPAGSLARTWELAQASLTAPEPMDTFGRRALKTRAFAAAILGDKQAVVVDVWTARAAGVSEDGIRTLAGYTAVADAYRRGARRVGIPARDLQAVTWCAIRGAAS